MSDLLTLKQAAQVAQVSYGTIIYWMRTGRLVVSKGQPSLRSGTPFGTFCTREDLEKADPNGRESSLRAETPALMSLTELANGLGIGLSSGYKLIDRYQLEKTYVDGTSYLINRHELAIALADDPTYHHLLKQARPGILL
jgi:transposase